MISIDMAGSEFELAKNVGPWIMFWGEQYHPFGGAEDKNQVVTSLSEANNLAHKLVLDISFDWAHLAIFHNTKLVITHRYERYGKDKRYMGQFEQAQFNKDGQ